MPTDIIEETYRWAYPLVKFAAAPRYLVLHHEAGYGTAQQIHACHLAKGWSGIAYHLYVRRDGSVYRGRPADCLGAHCKGYNGASIGICFEGDFETDTMDEPQLRAGLDAVRYALGVWPGMRILGHRELCATACPGKNFPLDRMKEAVNTMTGEEIYEKLCEYLAALPCPDWAAEELAEAQAAGITDGSRPMLLIPRYQAAIMAKRAAGK